VILVLAVAFGVTFALSTSGLPRVGADLDWVLQSAGQVSAGLIRGVIRAFELSPNSRAGVAAIAVAAVLTAPLLSLLVAEAASTSPSVRSGGVLLLLGGAGVGFVVLPGDRALVLFLLALAVAGVLTAARGTFLRFISALLVSAVAGRYLILLWHGALFTAPAVAALSAAAGSAGPHLHRLLTLTVIAAVVAPQVLALKQLLTAPR
jgi:hypothetical protein